MKYTVVISAMEHDGLRLRKIFDNIIEVIDDNCKEILIAIDKSKEIGRIAALHGDDCKELIDTSLFNGNQLVRVEYINYAEVKILRKYGISSKAIKCIGGTPIFQYLWAIDKANYDIQIKMDCDMLLSGRIEGEKLTKSLYKNEVMPLPDLRGQTSLFSTRAFCLNRKLLLKNKIRLRRNYGINGVKNILNHGHNFVALEYAWRKIKFRSIENIGINYTMHVPRRCDFKDDEITAIIDNFHNYLGTRCTTNNHNYSRDEWK